MSKIILGAMAAGAAFAGFLGTQITQSSASNSNGAATPAKNVGDGIQSSNPVVIELFTSQGCSSCPPADMLAKRLAKDGNLLVITRPVTYWDRLGWKDTLAREENTRLQRAYARKDLAGSGVYTPQIVVNGGGGAVGSREGDIRSLVRLAKNTAGPSIETTRDERGQVIVTISGKSDYMAGVSLLALSSSENVSVARGENGGRKLHYTNVVKDERTLGSWTGKQIRYTLSNQDLSVDGADKYAIIVQRPNAGFILGAKLLDL
ncbi:hypothetical protein that often co-occurs with aconitase [hydrothermal vent metagenome]|uniref:DUF1223 domain-containing protein n=1 Tax=hydrothermal vent metagenome TaxID=652676 RepID=A0A3B0T848_9ZZZZ